MRVRTSSAVSEIAAALDSSGTWGTQMGSPIWIVHFVGTGNKPKGPSRGNVGVMGM
jgi:hypothetical protein